MIEPTKTLAMKGRQKFVAITSALALAATMVGVAPATALAQDIEGVDLAIAAQKRSAEFEFIQNPLDVELGTQVNLNTNADCPDGYHLEWYVTGGQKFGTVNKRGMFSPTAIGTCKVTAYLFDGPTVEQGSNNNPDYALDSNVLNVNVVSGDQSDYTYQGIGGQSIMMTSPEVTKVSGNDNAGWTNTLGGVNKANGKMTFNISMSAGYGTPQESFNDWLDYNLENVSYVYNKKINGIVVQDEIFLDDPNITVEATGYEPGNNSNIVITINFKALDQSAGNPGQLVFYPEFSGNNYSKVLGTTIAFDLVI